MILWLRMGIKQERNNTFIFNKLKMFRSWMKILMNNLIVLMIIRLRMLKVEY